MSRLFVITVFVFAWSKKYTLLLLGLQQLRSNLVRGGIVVASPQLLVSIRQVAACNFQLRVFAGSSTPNLPFNLRTESPIKCESVQRFKQGARMWQATDDRQTTLRRNASQSAKALALQEETPLKHTYVGKAVGWWASIVSSVGACLTTSVAPIDDLTQAPAVRILFICMECRKMAPPNAGKNSYWRKSRARASLNP